MTTATRSATSRAVTRARAALATAESKLAKANRALDDAEFFGYSRESVARLGAAVDYADEDVRRAEDELSNAIDADDSTACIDYEESRYKAAFA